MLPRQCRKTVTIAYQMKEYTGEVMRLKDAAPDPAVCSIAPTDARYTPPRRDYLLLRTDKRLMAFPLGGLHHDCSRRRRAARNH